MNRHGRELLVAARQIRRIVARGYFLDERHEAIARRILADLEEEIAAKLVRIPPPPPEP